MSDITFRDNVLHRAADHPCDEAPLAGQPHCFHLVTRTSGGPPGGPLQGTDIEACCWCGTRRTLAWEDVRDPRHGPFAQLWVRQTREEGS